MALNASHRSVPRDLRPRAGSDSMSCASGPPTAEPVKTLLELAVHALRAGRPADAMAPLRQAALLRPQAAMIHHDLGLACLETGLVRESVDAFRRAVASDPSSADAQFQRAMRHFDAADAVRRASAAFPSDQFDREVALLIQQTTAPPAWVRLIPRRRVGDLHRGRRRASRPGPRRSASTSRLRDLALDEARRRHRPVL